MFASPHLPGRQSRPRQRIRGRAALIATAIALVSVVLPPVSPASAEPGACAAPSPSAPMLITEDCLDPHFGEPVIEVREERTSPIPHTFVNGRFEGTDTRFAFYFPAAEAYEGRFFQSTHQLITSELASDASVAFAADSGGYLVQTNIGGNEVARTAEDANSGAFDPTIGGYRANAVAAKFSREVAAEIYGEHRPYGYLSGGSGGAYQVTISMENTIGVWDGGVPFVMGSSNAIPNVFTVRIHALRILRDAFPQIMDAISPGGSGDPYAGLTPEQQEALEEADRLGFPMRGWFDYPTLTGGPLRLVAGYVPILDPTYFDDFWNVPGYLGHDDPYGSLAAARIQAPATVTLASPLGGGAWLVGLDALPAGDLVGADIVAASGQRASVFQPAGPNAVVVLGDASFLSTGATVTIDNSDYLAMQTYHRHQVPDDPGLVGWDQFRDADGDPIYPQRDVLIGPRGVVNGAGALQTGQIHGKMIGVQTMMDIDALPWQADWYRNLVHEAGYGDDFRLYYVDHADHSPDVSGARQAQLVPYRGALEQALRDVVAWVEDGTPPPRETNYDVVDSQVLLPERASQRRGIQPVVDLDVNRRDRADVAAGDAVRFTAKIQVPPRTGEIVDVEWDFEGDGTFVPGELDRIRPGTVHLRLDHTYDQPGTYFPVLRVTSQREGDPDTPFARVQNLDRVRVVVG
jgi:PKD domain